MWVHGCCVLFYSLNNNAFYKMGSNEVSTRRYCSVTNLTAEIINVQNFTNLRQPAGLNGRIIGRVGLGETVQILNPGSYLRTNRCAAVCEGSNQQTINQCIDNNEVWIEVKYNGRRGFLSRKFLSDDVIKSLPPL